ncbi:MAG: hypothetical protein FJW69_05705 [Actinobacteria bacterium]|nr:hypothetical protein [Actinomycetota bacterium]
MFKKTARILSECIDDIKLGKCSVENCISKYPYMQSSLRPLLEVAFRIQTLQDIEPSSDYKNRARHQLMKQIYNGIEALIKRPPSGYLNKIKPLPARRKIVAARLKMAALFIIVIFAISTMGTGTIYASQDSLPGDMLYPVKLITEKVELLTVRDSVSRVELYLKWTDKRVGEIKDLADRKNADKVDIAVYGYSEALNIAMENLEIDEAAELVALATTRQLAVLEEVFEKVPEQSQSAIKIAIEASKKGHEAAIWALKKDKGENIVPGKTSIPEYVPDRAKNKVDNTSIEEGKDLSESAQEAMDEAEEKAGENEDIKEKDDFIDSLPVPENVKEIIKGILR